MAALRFIQRHGIAMLALFIALGGTTYAAVRIPPNSIGPKHLKKNAVTQPKIKSGAVNGAKIAKNSVTGANILESSLGQVPSAAHADTATNAAHATSADSATLATTAQNATKAEDAAKLDGVVASGYQRRITGTCDYKAIESVAADGSVNCAQTVVKIAFDVGNNDANDPPGPLPWLHIGSACNVSAGNTTIVAFINTGSSAATLNWIYADKNGIVSAGGEPLAAGGEKDFGFDDNRIEGQFVFANADRVTTVNLHAFESGSCEIRGTAEVAP